jgi:hypothetical protein
MKVYRVTLKTTDGKLAKYLFYQKGLFGSVLDIYEDAEIQVERFDKEDNQKWVIFNIEKIN